MDVDLLSAAILVVVGVGAGALNTIAGGGSFLTLPALIWIGLPATVANGTNRIAVLLQSLVGARAMHRRIQFDVRATLALALPTLVGAVAGAWIATALTPDTMRTVIGVALLAGAGLVGLRPQRFLAARSAAAVSTERTNDDTTTPHGAVAPTDEATAPRSGPLVWGAMLIVGLYGGFLQAGVGALLLLAIAGVARWDLLEATGAKNLVVACFTIPALAVFVWQDAVALAPGLVLAAGNVAGAEIGARLAVFGGKRLIAAAVVVMLILAGIRLLTG